MKANTPQYTVAICPVCGKNAMFTPGRVDMGNGIERTLYECRQCGHQTTVCYTSPAIREAMEQQRAIVKTGNRDEIRKMAQRIEIMMDVLLLEMEGSKPTGG